MNVEVSTHALYHAPHDRLDPVDTGQTLCFRVVDVPRGRGTTTFSSTRHKYPFYKTKTCFHYNPMTRSGCKFGDRCSFAHGDEELRHFSR